MAVADRKVELIAPDEPTYSRDRTVLVDPTNFTIKHPLQHRWTLWYDNPGKKTSQESWGSHLKQIVSFDTVSTPPGVTLISAQVEDFWR